MPETIVRLLEQGAESNYQDRFRQGNVVHLPAEGSLIATGDLHGHRRNFERIVTAADIGNRPDRHVVLQEIIHGGPENTQGGCLSYQLLFDVVRYKVGFGDRVHILMGNHDTAYINDIAVMKNGKEMNESMRLALDREFQQDSERIKTAISQYLLSQPLAVRCPNRIWLSHSLPGNAYVDAFNKQVLVRRLRAEDLVRPASGYLLTWGRNHSQESLDKMARLLDVDSFILGHQRQEQGWCRAGDNLIILGSDHNHGRLLPIELGRTYTIEELVDSIVPLTSIA